MRQRKPQSRQPTPKQRKAGELLVENSRKDHPDPLGTVLLNAGYSKATAIKPTQVTRSEGFIQLMDKVGATDEKLARVLNEGLEATKAVVMGMKSDESFVDIQPDHPTRHKYLETGLRLKGFGKEASSFNFNFVNISRDLYK
jgi:hypothetical protein